MSIRTKSVPNVFRTPRAFFTSPFTLLLLFLSLFSGAVFSQERRGNLVTVEWLERELQRGTVLVLDASPAFQYAKEHIPGAINADFFAYGGADYSADSLSRRYQRWGLSRRSTVVLYDRDRPMMAMRLFFDLYRHGFPVHNLFILDGGLSRWKSAGKPVAATPTPAPPPGTFTVTQTVADAEATLQEVLTATGDRTSNTLVEALDAQWHYGGTQFFSRPGHIPYSVLLPSDDFFREDKTFKSDAEIRTMLQYHGVSPQQTVYTYCGGGIAASVPYFALKFLLNYPSVKLFSASELGWLQDERELPFWTYSAPYRLRETDWVTSWGGKMMRMYGVSKMNIVDIRSSAEYAKGHIPFAINLPLDTLRRYASQTDILTEKVLDAGLHPAYETVIVSGRGVTKESALAFVLLEHCGMQKVSLFSDSDELFVQRGAKLVSDKTGVVSQRTNAAQLRPRNGIVLTDPYRTTGLYPKVFIASGRTLPEHRAGATVVHLPYASFLDGNGKPKAAKEIWKILHDAGIPRYGEFICISEDPAEAAMNYVILLLMGFPDIKILL